MGSWDHDELPGLGWVWVGPVVHWLGFFVSESCCPCPPAHIFLALPTLRPSGFGFGDLLPNHSDSTKHRKSHRWNPIKNESHWNWMKSVSFWMSVVMCLHHSQGWHQCNYLEKLKKIMEVWQVEVNGRPRAFEDVGFETEIRGPR